MESQTLYRVKKEDLPKLEKLLVKCFAHDPLYCKLIPEKETRERLLPELFKCDLTEFIETCEIYSDSEEMNSLLVVSDESEPYNPLTFYLTEAWASLKTDEYLIKEDPSLKTLWNFMRGRDYLNSRWTERIKRARSYDVLFALSILLPLAPDDYLCYFSGLINMSVKKFVLIILLAKPWCILFYSFGTGMLIQ
mgnify:CR=1 FL=1